MISFDKIVNKLLKKWWKLLFKDDIFEIIDPEKKPEYTTLVNKTIYSLKAKWVIISLRNWVYLVPQKEDLKLNEIDLLEKYYYELLKKYITFYCMSDYYISWNKSLQLHLKDYQVVDKIYIVNRKIDKKIKIWNYTIIFKTIKWNDNNKSKNLYSKMSSLVENIELFWINFKVSCLELALVESALITDNNEGIDITLINKALKKYSKFFDIEKFRFIWQFKFIMSFNRLKELSKSIDEKLYFVFLDIIKKNWGLFIWETLRKI